MARKVDRAQGALFHRPEVPGMPDGYYSSGPNPNLRRFVASTPPPTIRRRTTTTAAVRPADHHHQGDGDLQHAHLLVEEAARRDPAVYQPLHPAGRIGLDPFAAAAGQRWPR